MTEAEMIQLLRARHITYHGNGPAWVFMTQVRNAAGFDATATADAIAMHLWPSEGLRLSGYEVKVSRADWLRELKRPEKAERVARLVDYWTVVAPKGVVKTGELPETWGLIEERNGILASVVRPECVPAKPLTRSFVASLLRAAAREHLVVASERDEGAGA